MVVVGMQLWGVLLQKAPARLGVPFPHPAECHACSLQEVKHLASGLRCRATVAPPNDAVRIEVLHKSVCRQQVAVTLPATRPYTVESVRSATDVTAQRVIVT